MGCEGSAQHVHLFNNQLVNTFLVSLQYIVDDVVVYIADLPSLV